MFSMYFKYEIIVTHAISISQVITIIIVSILILIWSINSTVGSAFWNMNKWEKIFQKLESFELLLTTNTSSDNTCTNIIIITSSIFFIVITIINYIRWTMVLGIKVQTQIYFVQHWLLATLFIGHMVNFLITQSLRKYFGFLSEKLKQRYSYNKTKMSLYFINSQYRKLFETCISVSSIQGARTFTSVICAGTLFLNYFNAALLNLHSNSFSITMFCFTSLMGITYLVRILLLLELTIHTDNRFIK